MSRSSEPCAPSSGRVVAVAVALLLVAAACGSSSSDDAPTASPSTTGGPAGTAGAVAAADRVVAPGEMRTFAVPRGSRPHDVAPSADGSVWYTAQGSGKLGSLDPATGRTSEVELGP
ncbi:MAG TPA: hypothetical protein VG078_03450, partial [Acidimicrobiales bacterium]|nr:hypothetical protein [Acidimicrobiales bacterium]